VELRRLEGWKPAARFAPSKNDFIFIGKTGFYTQDDRVALIVRWRDTAEKEALNAILLMMTGGM
jgi:hypothetical protein